ncbi:MAG: hypothetical protein TE42_08135 [Candidatus Synechococcus spongiarum SP3]|uniref:Uncharacterized protein n=1 Tax=Candidatus Synechococcus spongiarum SP3 TaxID=1604020 RepID=A0A0G2IVT7_9SYNE|nr:MAG: hypothetical protein TE42_08135 [Candidatus Synechococcus spongiarum SP3]
MDHGVRRRPHHPYPGGGAAAWRPVQAQERSASAQARSGVPGPRTGANSSPPHACGAATGTRTARGQPARAGGVAPNAGGGATPACTRTHRGQAGAIAAAIRGCPRSDASGHATSAAQNGNSRYQ